jgi:peptidoglycan/LPS O-acetylase OafA/YrhL
LPVSGADPEAPRSTGFYAPELDGLRCLAVGTVMIAHFSPTLSRYADWGSLGVRLFFVLSGFLITLALLRARDRHEPGATRPRALRQFFVRRIFRLWPLYFASLLAAYGLHVAGAESSLWWHLTFATNQYVFLHQHWPDLLSHFWTLAVEQQFYVVWPFVLLFLPRRYFSAALLVTLLAGPATRAALAWRPGADPRFDGVLLPCCLDFFALGAALAWWRGRQCLDRIATASTLRALIFAGAIWIVLGAALKSSGRLPVGWSIYDGLIQGLTFAAVITHVLLHPASLAARGLRAPALVYLGQISYGIYIFHNFMHHLGPAVLRRTLGYNYFPNEVLHVLFLTTLSILVAAVSYHCFEEPLRKLGRRFA